MSFFSAVGDYITRVGSWGLAFGALGCVMLIGLVLEVYQAATMHSVTAQVHAKETACVLTYFDGNKDQSDLAETCAEAEATKANSTDRLYEIEQHVLVTMVWPTQDGRIAKKRLSPQKSKPFKRYSVGDKVNVRVGDGKRPGVERPMTLSTVGIFTAAIAFIFWRIWPWRGQKSGGAGIYVRESRRGSRLSQGVREFVVGLAVKSSMLGVCGALFGGVLWFSEIRGKTTYTESTAQVLKTETTCRLKFRDEDEQRRTSEEMSCERAESIAQKNVNVDYDIRETHTVFLKYSHPIAGETVIEKDLTLLHGQSSKAGSIIPILFNPERATRIRVVRKPHAFSASRLLFFLSLAVTSGSAWVASAMGAYIVWPGQGRKTTAPSRRAPKQQTSSDRLQQIRSRRRPRVEP